MTDIHTTTLIIHPQPLYGIPQIKFESQMIRNFAIITTATEATVPVCDILSFYVYETKKLNADTADLLFHPDIFNHLCVQNTAGQISRYTPDQILVLSLNKSLNVGVYTYDNSPLICIKLRDLPKTFVFYSKISTNDAMQFIRQEYINLNMAAIDVVRLKYDDDMHRPLPLDGTPLMNVFNPEKLNVLRLYT